MGKRGEREAGRRVGNKHRRDDGPVERSALEDSFREACRFDWKRGNCNFPSSGKTVYPSYERRSQGRRSKIRGYKLTHTVPHRHSSLLLEESRENQEMTRLLSIDGITLSESSLVLTPPSIPPIPCLVEILACCGLAVAFPGPCSCRRYYVRRWR